MAASAAVEVEHRADVRFLPAYGALFDPSLRWFFMWGGRDAGRSWAASRKIVIEAMESRIRVACIRWTRQATRDSMRAEVLAAIHETGNEHFWDLTKDRDITFLPTGSVIMFRGLLNQQGLRSLVDVDVVWFEEPQYLEDPDFHDCLITVLRKETVRLFFTGNAQFESDPAYRWCLEERDRPHAAWLYTTSYDNDEHMTDDAKREREKARKFDPDRYEHEWLGKPRRTSSEQTVLSEIWLQAALRGYGKHERFLRGFEGQRDFGLDPSDGGDRCVVGCRSGPFTEHIEDVTQPRGLIDLGLDRVSQLVRGHGGRFLLYDDGSAVGTQVTNYYAGQRMPYSVVAVPFGGAPLGRDEMFGSRTNGQVFPNRSVQMAWNLRLRFEASWLLEQGQKVRMDHCAFVDPTCVNGRDGAPTERGFVDQMVQAEWRRVDGGRIHVDKQPRGLPSPDIFDEVRLSYHQDLSGGLRMVR